MKQWWREWYNKYAVVVAATIAGYLGSTQICWSAVEGQTWAAWVQAIGATIGIGIAISVPVMQHRQAIERDRVKEFNEIRHDLQSLRDELEVYKLAVVVSIGDTMSKLSETSYVKFEWGIEPVEFVIYKGISARLGRVPDEKCRTQIIAAYGHLQSMFFMFRENTSMLSNLRSFVRLKEVASVSQVQQAAVYKEHAAEVEAELRIHAKALKRVYENTVEAVGSALTSIDVLLLLGAGRG